MLTKRKTLLRQPNTYTVKYCSHISEQISRLYFQFTWKQTHAGSVQRAHLCYITFNRCPKNYISYFVREQNTREANQTFVWLCKNVKKNRCSATLESRYL